MIRFPNCKINLGLHVTARRDDGFHEIETVFLPVPIHDALEILPAGASEFTFSATGLPIPGAPDGNLCVKAFRLLEERYGIPPVAIHLHKAIPMGSGLGGGSADGAFTLAMLRDLFQLPAGDDTLQQLALKLGSDCPFFLANEPSHATGRGEIMTPVAVRLGGLFLALVIPPVHVSTREAYGMVRPQQPLHSLRELLQEPVENWKNEIRNDFQEPISARYPVIRGGIRELYDMGALYASMSGSGSAVYGLFRDWPRMDFPGYFTAVVRL